MKKEIGFIGLGKMGKLMTFRLRQKGWRVVGFDAHKKGDAASIQDLMSRLSLPRLVWLMVPAGKPVDEVLNECTPLLQKGDVIIDGGNSFYEDSRRRSKKLSRLGVAFLDAGVSGGREGARNGACLMVGGDKRIFKRTEPLFCDLAAKDSYRYMGNSGAGHFVKMAHNGIEYGMMQAIAEGFALLKKGPYALSLQAIAHLYNHGSIVESRLMKWLEQGYATFGEDLKEVGGSVGRTGEGEWTVKTARKFHVETPVIKDSVLFRVRSEKNPSYAGKILSVMRNQFGGHPFLSENKVLERNERFLWKSSENKPKNRQR